MKRLFFALAAVLMSALPAAAQVHPVGYIGCSNSRDSVTGYHLVLGNLNRFWPAYQTGGGSVERWANPSSSYWFLYDQQLAVYGQPAAVWVNLCEEYQARPSSYAAVQAMLGILRAKSPGAAVFISAINAYDPPALCSFMGTAGQGETDTNAWRDRAVADGLGQLGPAMGTLTVLNTIYDRCHPNLAGERLLGRELRAFFDR